MSWERIESKVKKGYIVAIKSVPDEAVVTFVDFIPKTISKITMVVALDGGSAITIILIGIQNFPIFGDQSYPIYSNEFTEDGVAEIPGYSFHEYIINVSGVTGTVGSVYIFLEYDYDLIK